jgi:hypothetical protein
MLFHGHRETMQISPADGYRIWARIPTDAGDAFPALFAML